MSKDTPQTGESERRIATVMFADMAGFTALSEKYGAERVSELMNKFFPAMEVTIDHHGGVVDKFIGDCVMALFGAPVTTGDSAANAVKAALAMQKKWYSIRKKVRIPAPVTLQIGINTGRVVAGTVGGEKRRDYTVIGDAVNVAARLEGLSKEGQILVGSDTWAATRDRFHYKRLPPVILKGKSQPVAVFELVDAKHPRESPPAQTGKRGIGRDSQVRLISSLVSTGRVGPGKIITISGEAGIGKSNLIEDVKRACRRQGTLRLEGSALAIGRHISYYPFAAMLRNWSEVSETDDPGTAFKKIATAVNGLGGEDNEAAVLHIASIMGINPQPGHIDGTNRLDADALELLVSQHIKQLLERLASQRPLMLIMEDLHWADDSSLGLLFSLFRLVTSVPIIFVNVYRPGYATAVDNLMQTTKTDFGRLATELPLGPLNRFASGALVDELSPGGPVPEAMKNEIVNRTGGNPYFIHEVMASIREQAAHAPSSSTKYKLEMPNMLDVPTTINDVLMERIDRLEIGTRQSIRMAAVIGKLFLGSILIEITDPATPIDHHLDQLLSAGFLVRNGSSREIRYEFKHALVQETLYDSILMEQRKKWHRQIAAAIQSIYAERLTPFYGMLAYHYSRAEDLDNAEKYMIMAGRESLKVGGSNEAICHYRKAFAIYMQKSESVSDPIRISAFERHIALSFYNKGLHKEAFRHYERALARYGHTDLCCKPVRCLSFLFGLIQLFLSLYAPMLFWRKTPTEKDAVLAELFYMKLACLANVDPQKFLTGAVSFARYLSRFDLKTLKNGVGMVAGLSVAFAWSAGSFAVSRKIIALIKKKHWQVEGKSALYFALAELFTDYYTGQWEKPYDKSLVENGLQIGEVMHTAAYILFHGRIQIEAGHPGIAKQLAARLADIANTFSHDFSLGMKYYLSTKLLLKYRKIEAARLEVEEGIQFAGHTDFKQLLFVFHAFNARVHVYSNDGDRAEKSLAEAEKLIETLPITTPYLSNYLISKLAVCLHKLAGARPPAAAKYRQEARVVCRKTISISRKLTHERTEAYRLAGTFFYLSGGRRQAEKWWIRSIREGERLGARLELSRTYLVVGKYLANSGRPLGGRTAEEYHRLARTLSDQLQLHWGMAWPQDIVRIG